MASLQRPTGRSLGLACLLVTAAAAALPPLCPPNNAPPLPLSSAETELTPLCETRQLERSGGLLTPVACPTAGCRCDRQRPGLRCVPFNTTVTQRRRGSVPISTTVTVACVCALPRLGAEAALAADQAVETSGAERPLSSAAEPPALTDARNAALRL